MSSGPSLSVVVPATDGPPTLERCIAAVASADDPPEEIIVVDAPADLAASAARNVGVDRASGDIVVFVDADVEVHRDAFFRIRAAFTAAPELTAIHGSYDDEPDDRRTVSVFRNLLHHHVHQQGAGPAETFWTGLGAIRRRAFLEVGGFDEVRYVHPSIEDIELGHRMSEAGAELRLDPSIQGKHLKAWSLRSMVWTDFARRAVPWLDLQLRSRRLSSALNCGWTHRLSAAACAVAVVALVASQPLIALGCVAGLLWLNRSFYALLVRRLGALRAVAGLALHALHHLVALAAVPAALAVFVSGLPRSAPATSPRAQGAAAG